MKAFFTAYVVTVGVALYFEHLHQQQKERENEATEK